MTISMLKSKIHRAKVTEANLHYVGSITIDQNLMDAAGLLEYEQVAVVDVDNGNRLETYVIAGEAGRGDICMNGAAARWMHVGDRVIIMAYAQMPPQEAAGHRPQVVFVNEDNRIVHKTDFEKHGQIESC